MKKLMMAAAIVCAAVAANATTVKWGLTTSQTLDATKVDTGTFYLVYTTGTMDWSAFNKAAGTSYGKSDLYAAGATDVFDSFTYNPTISGSTAITGTTVGPDSGKAIGVGNKKFYYVCIDDGGKDIAYTSAGKQANIQNSTMQAASTVLASAFSYAHIEDEEPEPTPEPTSAMLMLLGVAGLALKRKQK